MSFRQNDIVEFEGGSKVLVIEAIQYENEEYVFVNEFLEENELSNNYKVMYVNYSNGSLKKVVDVDLLGVLLPMFEYKLKNQLESESQS